MKFKLTQDKVTNNAIRYKEDSYEEVIGKIYFKRSVFEGETPPEHITVDVDFGDL